MPDYFRKSDIESLVRRSKRMLEKSLIGDLPIENRPVYERMVKYFSQVEIAWPEWIRIDPRYREVYEYAKRKGLVVDHVVPLNSEIVCGLHVPWNLQAITALENQAKSNKWWPDCPFEIEDMFGEAKPHQMRLCLE